MKEQTNTTNLYWIINLNTEYPGANNIFNWAIVSDLNETQLLSQYPKLILYTPFLLLTSEHGEVIRSYRRNEEKHLKRRKRSKDFFGYMDSETPLDSVRYDIKTPALLLERQTEEKKLDKFLKFNFTQKQYARIRLLLEGYTENEIASFEGVSQPAISQCKN